MAMLRSAESSATYLCQNHGSAVTFSEILSDKLMAFPLRHCQLTIPGRDVDQAQQLQLGSLLSIITECGISLSMF
jgi:hypothetical protein